MNYGALFRSAIVTLLRNKMRSILTVLGITIGIAAVICVVAIGNAGQARVQQHLNNLGDNFVWIEAGGRAVNGVRTGTHDTKTLVMADAIAIKNQISLSNGNLAFHPLAIRFSDCSIEQYLGLALTACFFL